MAATLLIAVPVIAAEGRALRAGPVPPSQWPNSHLAAPQIEGWPNALRIFGADRYQTSLATALTTRGSGGFPFDSADATSAGAAGLSAADGWWGLDVCPKAVVIVAGDSQADALSAAVLSDPTGQSTEPYLRRVAAADPLFDPPGGFARVDTFAAPVLLTPSVRSGAQSLAVPVRLAAQDLRAGGCNAARQAIIVGGNAAIAPEVETELVSIGYTEVFRVSGDTRFGTAAAVASALGTAPVPPDASRCADASAADRTASMGFWANSVVEWRSSAAECRLLGRSVVLTDGVDGIDAIAAGWWTSFWQVPVLLHDGSNRLRPETARALSLLDIEHLIVLGGTSRLPAAVVDSAARLAGAEVIRVAGPNRYSTSIEMAKQFGGWWPGEDGRSFESSLVCLAASSGSGRTARGWADALGAGAWCGAASGAAANPGTPNRVLSGVTVAKPAIAGRPPSGQSGTDGDAAAPRPRRDAVPVLLVPVGANRLPPSMDEFLTDAFRAPDSCAALVGRGAAGDAGDTAAYRRALERGSCPMPGFAVAFGGSSVISRSLLGTVSSILSGGLTAATAPTTVLIGAETPDPFAAFGVSSVRGVPIGVGAFATELDMSPVFHQPAEDTSVQYDRWVCLPRGTYMDARWLLTESTSAAPPLWSVDVPSTGWYAADVDGEARSPGTGAPACLAAPLPAGTSLLARAVSAHGRTSHSLLLAADIDRKFELSGAVSATEPTSSGVPSGAHPLVAGSTRWVFEADAVDLDATLGDERSAVISTRLILELRHRAQRPAEGEQGPAERPSTFKASWTVTTSAGTVRGIAEGEATLYGGQWRFRGASVLTDGTWPLERFGPPNPAVEEFGPTPPAPAAAEPVAALRAGTSDGYGAGGFTATLTVNRRPNTDDTIVWRPEAFVNLD